MAWDNITMEQTEFQSADGVIHRWYRGNTVATGNAEYHLGYARSTDGVTWEKWSGNPLLASQPIIFPIVKRVGDRVLLFVEHDAMPYYTGWFMYDITNPTSPTILNGGNAILLPTAQSYTGRYYNVGFATVDNTTIHALAEYAPAGTFNLYYTHGTLSGDNLTGLNANMTATPVILNAGNAELHYIPERDAILALHGKLVGGIWRTITSYAYLTDNLDLATSWHEGVTLVSKTGIHICDPSLVIGAPGAAHELILSCSYDQLTIHSYHSDYTLLQLFDRSVAGTPTPFTEYTGQQWGEPEGWPTDTFDDPAGILISGPANYSTAVSFSASGHKVTTGVTVTQNSYWRQYGDIITVRAPIGTRVATTATITANVSGAVIFDGAQSSRFEISTDGGSTWSSSGSVSAGSNSVLLDCTAQSGDTSLSARIGVPT